MKFRTDLAANLAGLKALKGMGGPVADRLSAFDDFGSNPGQLAARIYLPKTLLDHAPLVVVLHGCTQTAAGYDHGSGWSALADRYGFALLYPEQQRVNNANGCFNWFEPGDIRRGSGEALSIRQMIGHMLVVHRLDPRRVFVTGLSAGGAMTSVMLATYPEVFAGGAVIAGLPFGRAASMPEAFEAMRGGGSMVEGELGDLIRKASRHGGPWPRVSVWHGGADRTVDASNADLIVNQWRNLHGLRPAPDKTETVDGQTRRIWCAADGRALVEDYRIAGMGHGTPLSTLGPDGYGASGAFMLDVAISSTLHIAQFWGLTEASASAASSKGRTDALPLVAPPIERDSLDAADDLWPEPTPGPAPELAVGSPRRIIEDALRAAGLMR